MRYQGRDLNNFNMQINKEWHLSHPMPKNATVEQRIEWHLAHLKHCRCRPDIPGKLKEEMKKRNIAVPVIAKKYDMKKVDLKKELGSIYKPSAKKMEILLVPELNYLMIDGFGDPNGSKQFQDAVEALYSLSYTIKFMFKKGEQQIDYGVMPLEGLWWADDMESFHAQDKAKWKWTLMIMQPAFVTKANVAEAKKQVLQKKGLAALGLVRFGSMNEGLSAQVLYTGPYSAEAPTIAKLHEFIKESGYKLHGKHREIYLNDMRRTAPERLKTIIRQSITK